jgi:hypothetical protein
MGGKATGAFIFIVLGASMAAAQEPAAPQGPVSYWKFDETTGTTTTNNVTGGPTGTHQGGVTIVTTGLPPAISYKNTACRSFNGTNAVIQVPNFGSFPNMSVSTWIYRTGGPGSRQSIVSYKETGGGFVLSLNESNPNEYPRIWLNQGGWQNKEQGVAIPLNTWTHLAATYDATTLTLYRDGVSVATGAIAGNMTNPTANTGIGARNSWDQHWFQGLIDDVRIYQRALDATEVSVLAAGCPVPQNLTTTLTTGPVTLTWAAPTGATPLGGYKYNVMRGDVSGTYNYQVATGISATTFVDNTIVVGNTYYYVVTALSCAESGNSVEAVAFPPISVSPTTGLFTSELPTSAPFNIKFNLAVPAGDTVRLTITSSDSSEGQVTDGLTSGAQIIHDVVGPVSVPFTLPITINGQPDLIADGPINYTVTVTTSCLTNATFNNLTIPPINVTNNDDNDAAGISFNKTAGLLTTEAGGTDSFSVTLLSQPNNVITVTLTNNRPTEVSLSQSVLTFNPANWNIPQVVTLTGLDDTVLDFTQPFTITGVVGVTDPVLDSAYVGMLVPAVNGINLDDEVIPPAKGAWGGSGGGCGLLGLEAALLLLLRKGARRQR